MKQWQLWAAMTTVALTLGACGTASGTKTGDIGSKGICKMTQTDSAGAGRKVVYRCDGNAVLNAPETQALLLSDVKVSFSDGGSVIKSNVPTRQAANRVGHTDEETCIRAFVNAAKRFQEAAKKQGGTRVTGLHSYYDRKPQSGGIFDCEVGTFHGRVVMRANLAR